MQSEPSLTASGLQQQPQEEQGAPAPLVCSEPSFALLAQQPQQPPSRALPAQPSFEEGQLQEMASLAAQPQAPRASSAEALHDPPEGVVREPSWEEGQLAAAASVAARAGDTSGQPQSAAGLPGRVAREPSWEEGQLAAAASVAAQAGDPSGQPQSAAGLPGGVAREPSWEEGQLARAASLIEEGQLAPTASLIELAELTLGKRQQGAAGGVGTAVPTPTSKSKADRRNAADVKSAFVAAQQAELQRKLSAAIDAPAPEQPQPSGRPAAPASQQPRRASQAEGGREGRGGAEQGQLDRRRSHRSSSSGRGRDRRRSASRSRDRGGRRHQRRWAGRGQLIAAASLAAVACRFAR